MAKKRSCDRTEEEIKIHAAAVKLRKMTDTQLYEHVTALEKQSAPKSNVSAFIESLSGVKGIGATTIAKLSQHAEANGFV